MGEDDQQHAEQVFSIADVAVGPHAHGFGAAADGRAFSFRVVGSTMTVCLYRPDLDPAAVPTEDDVDAIAEAPVKDLDLTDERSVVAMVRDMTAYAVPAAQESPGLVHRVLRTLFGPDR